jgi:hypothetical protein
MSTLRQTGILCGIVTMLVAAAGGAGAQNKYDPGEIHGLKLGLKAAAMTLNDWGELTCASGGEKPQQALEAWSDFKKCPPQASGLREVAARFDDEDEYIGRAIDNPLYAGQHTGTRVAGHPVILSVLFDDTGILRGIRFVTDPHGTPLERRMAHLLGLVVINHYGPDGWTCTDLPAAAGETPVGGVFIKQRCVKATPERAMTLEVHFLRGPGEHAIDPDTHDYRPGQFESWTRFELLDPNYRKP